MPSKSFKDTIKRFFMINALVPLTLLLIFFVIFSIINSRQIIINRTNKSSGELSLVLEETNNAYLLAIEKFATSETFIEYVKGLQNSPDVFQSFYDFNNQQLVKSTLYLFNLHGNVMLSSAVRDMDSSDAVLLQEMMQRIDRAPHRTLGEANHIRHIQGNSTTYAYGRQLRDLNEKVGYIFLLMHEDDLQKMIFDTNVNISVLTDQYDTIIATTNTGIVGFLNKFNPVITTQGTRLFGDELFYMRAMPVFGSNFTLYSLSTLKNQPVFFLWLFTFLLLASILVLILLRKLAINLSYKVTSPIDKMMESIKKLQQGNLQSYVRIDSGDEFQMLADQYNIMLDRINALMSQNLELSETRRITEIKHLESQFNPHLIFNVLETLRYSVSIKPEQAQKIILSLSRLLRYTIRSHEQKVLLDEDLRYLEDYLSLHKLRFGEHLQYDIFIHDDMKSESIPRLLLQPIVENSIKYGYRNQDSLHIKISAERVDTDLLFEISDDGGGMDTVTLLRLQSALDGRHSKPVDMGIGIYNLHRRIQLLFGNRYGLKLRNIETGLEVSIRVPRIQSSLTSKE